MEVNWYYHSSKEISAKIFSKLLKKKVRVQSHSHKGGFEAISSFLFINYFRKIEESSYQKRTLKRTLVLHPWERGVSIAAAEAQSPVQVLLSYRRKFSISRKGGKPFLLQSVGEYSFYLREEDRKSSLPLCKARKDSRSRPLQIF